MKTKKIKFIYKQQQLQIEYFIRQGKEKTVLFIHGLGCSKNDFKGAASIAELQNHTLIAIDFPGCGNSSYPQKKAFEIDDLVEITNIIVTKLSLGKFLIMGHSMGGLIALLYTQRYRETVSGFINIEGNLAAEDCFLSRKIITLTQLSLFENIDIDIIGLKCSKND